MRRLKYCILLLLLSFPLSAQESFDSITVKRIKPADLPDPSESVLPDVLRGALMPKIPNTRDIENMYKTGRSAMVEVIVELAPTSSLQRDPIIMRGQAVWLSANQDASSPVLVTPAHWVDGARRIFVAKPQTQPNSRDLPKARVTTLSGLNTRRDIKKIATDPNWTEVKVGSIDKHRNLATIEHDAPEKGLGFMDVSKQSPTYLYGVSALVDAPQQAMILQVDPGESDIVFYLQSDYPVALGAPLITPSAEVVALTAMHHPERPELTLIIPPLALKHFVEIQQGLKTSNLETDVDEDSEDK